MTTTIQLHVQKVSFMDFSFLFKNLIRAEHEEPKVGGNTGFFVWGGEMDLLPFRSATHSSVNQKSVLHLRRLKIPEPARSLAPPPGASEWVRLS